MLVLRPGIPFIPLLILNSSWKPPCYNFSSDHIPLVFFIPFFLLSSLDLSSQPVPQQLALIFRKKFRSLVSITSQAKQRETLNENK